MHHKKDNMQSITLDQSPLAAEFLDSTSINKKSEKYSLRQRQRRQSSRNKNVTTIVEPHAICANRTKSVATTVTPTASTTTISTTKSKQKSKPKAAPLSKYRRKTANARERTRMREINSAFENLRKCVPLSISSGTPTSTNEKLTKITTLRLAMKYIRTLNDVLNKPISESSFILSNVINNNNSPSKINNNLSSTSNSSSSCSSSNSSSNSSCSNVSFNNNNIHINNNNNNSSINNNISNSKDLFSEMLLSVANNSSNSISMYSKKRTNYKCQQRDRSKYMNNKLDISPCLNSPIDSPIDIALMLESDGESLHLSEPCLSPLSSQQIKSFSCTANNALELGLLFDSDNDSLQLSEPCLSPLGGLDALNPFGDLLNTGFSEQSSLDMYLT